MGLLGPVANFAYRQRKALLVLFLALLAGAAFYGKDTARALVGGGFDDASPAGVAAAVSAPTSASGSSASPITPSSPAIAHA